MKKSITPTDAIKLQLVEQRLRDIFDRDRTNPVELGTFNYVIRSVVEALKIEHLFYVSGNSPFVPPVDESDVIQWRKEINDCIENLYSIVEYIKEQAGIQDEI
jgi:hypothetical protein